MKFDKTTLTSKGKELAFLLRHDAKAFENGKIDEEGWREKFPNAKWFYTGGAWKGAYECSGEWGTDDWYDTDKMEELYELKDENPDDHGAVDILDEFDTFDDFKKALLNISLDGCNRDTRQMFEDEMTRSKHAPKHKLTDAEDLYSGEAMCEFINIETGEKKYLYYNAW